MNDFMARIKCNRPKYHCYRISSALWGEGYICYTTFTLKDEDFIALRLAIPFTLINSCNV